MIASKRFAIKRKKEPEDMTRAFTKDGEERVQRLRLQGIQRSRELGDLNSKGDRGANYQKEKESLAIKQQEADTLREQAAEQAKIAQAAAEAARILEIQNTESESILKTEEALVAAKNEGYLQSHGELTARWEILNAQLKTEESMGRGNSMAARRIRVEMDKTVQGAKVLNRAIAVDVAESESARKNH